MKKKHLAIAILAIYFGPMCIKWKITHMSEQELDWVSQYEVGQRRCYVSNRNETDTLEITEKKVYNSCWPISLHIGYNNEFIASFHLSFIIHHKKEEIDGSFGGYKEGNKEPINLTFLLGDRYALGGTPGPDFSFGLPLIQDMQFAEINGHMFYDCITIDDSNSKDNGTERFRHSITQFVWSKSKGLLQYTFDDGEVFVLKELARP